MNFLTEEIVSKINEDNSKCLDLNTRLDALIKEIKERSSIENGAEISLYSIPFKGSITKQGPEKSWRKFDNIIARIELVFEKYYQNGGYNTWNTFTLKVMYDLHNDTGKGDYALESNLLKWDDAFDDNDLSFFASAFGGRDKWYFKDKETYDRFKSIVLDLKDYVTKTLSI